MTLETMPMDLDSLGGGRGGLDEFRLRSPVEIQSMLRKLLDGNVVLHLNTPDGTNYSTTLWAVDAGRDVISFCVDAISPQAQALLESEEVTVVGYIESVKLQFELHGVVLVKGVRDSALNALMPREMFRFQRRNSFRVRPAGRHTPTAYMAHTMIPEMQLALRVLDVSLGGCALFLPDNVPALAPGVRINGVLVELDADTRMSTDLMLHHVTQLNTGSQGSRLGCEWQRLGSESSRALQRFIDQTQKRRRLLSID